MKQLYYVNINHHPMCYKCNLQTELPIPEMPIPTLPHRLYIGCNTCKSVLYSFARRNEESVVFMSYQGLRAGQEDIEYIMNCPALIEKDE